jgi:hypothetical protein
MQEALVTGFSAWLENWSNGGGCVDRSERWRHLKHQGASAFLSPPFTLLGLNFQNLTYLRALWCSVVCSFTHQSFQDAFYSVPSTDPRIVGIVSCWFSRSPAILLLTQHFNTNTVLHLVMEVCVCNDNIESYGLSCWSIALSLLTLRKGVVFLGACHVQIHKYWKCENFRNSTMFKGPVWDGELFTMR